MKELRKKVNDDVVLKKAVMDSVKPCIDLLGARMQQMEFGGSNMEKGELPPQKS